MYGSSDCDSCEASSVCSPDPAHSPLDRAQIEGIDSVERAFVHVDYERRTLEEHKVLCGVCEAQYRLVGRRGLRERRATSVCVPAVSRWGHGTGCGQLTSVAWEQLVDVLSCTPCLVLQSCVPWGCSS